MRYEDQVQNSLKVFEILRQSYIAEGRTEGEIDTIQLFAAEMGQALLLRGLYYADNPLFIEGIHCLANHLEMLNDLSKGTEK